MRDTQLNDTSGDEDSEVHCHAPESRVLLAGEWKSRWDCCKVGSHADLLGTRRSAVLKAVDGRIQNLLLGSFRTERIFIEAWKEWGLERTSGRHLALELCKTSYRFNDLRYVFFVLKKRNYIKIKNSCNSSRNWTCEVNEAEELCFFPIDNRKRGRQSVDLLRAKVDATASEALFE